MIYLDNAATTYPKPKSVISAAVNAVNHSGGNPGRSGHLLSKKAGKEIYSCREQIANLFGANEENIILTLNATYVINIAVAALCNRAKPIAISNIEHNAVYRPAIAHPAGYRVFDVFRHPENTVSELDGLIAEGVGSVICCHASNLCGVTSPIAKIGALCKARGVPFIVDASQSAGHLPINISEICADAICAPSHKGLYGIQGCGFAVFADKYSGDISHLSEFARGGSGVASLERHMPSYLPERYEAGTLPTPAAASLAEGIRFISSIGMSAISDHELSLSKRLIYGLKNINGVTVYGENMLGSAVLFNFDRLTSEYAAELLDSDKIAVRGGYHCAPLAHKALGVPFGGGIRASFSLFNRDSDVDALLRAVFKIAKGVR